MKIKVVTVGKLKEKYLKDGIAEYSKRISRFAKFEMIELSDEKHQIRPVNQKIKRF
ncbi:rRNA large subunit methyltransferase [Streptococcus pneumoniae]|nr:rRNA large subunit methyltransferase [Streptococcus pneumoniae]